MSIAIFTVFGRQISKFVKEEKIHANLFEQAKDAAKDGNDIELDSIYICPVCGHTILNGAPDNCPVCGTKKEMYKEF